MANYSRWEDVKNKRPDPTDDTRAGVEQDFALGQLIYDLRTGAGLSQRELAERMGTTQSVISRLEEGGGARNRLDTLARVATALDRHLIVSFPEVGRSDSKTPSKSPDSNFPTARNAPAEAPSGPPRSGSEDRIHEVVCQAHILERLPELRRACYRTGPRCIGERDYRAARMVSKACDFAGTRAAARSNRLSKVCA